MSEAIVPQADPQAQDAIRTSQGITNLLAAFVKAQAQFPAVKKDQTGKIQGESKRSGKDYEYEYSYADLAGILAAIQPILKEHGLGVMQPIVWNGSPWLLTRLVHESGEWMESRYRLGEHDRPQEMGSEITYARRYNLTSFLGITTEGDDDDGQRASENGGGRRYSGKSNLPPCPVCKDDEGRPTNKGVIVSKHGPGYYCHGHKAAFLIEEDGPRTETRTLPPEAPKPKPAPVAKPAEREPGADGEPPVAQIPAQGSPEWESPKALGDECMRLGGGQVRNAGDIMQAISGNRSARGLKPDAVRAAWLELAKHPTFGIGGAK